ncbi:hypothetical protein D3C85_1704850 [compost metagenome]
MKQWLPDMSQVGINQCDVCLVSAAQLITQPSGKLKSSGPTPDYNDAMCHVPAYECDQPLSMP